MRWIAGWAFALGLGCGAVAADELEDVNAAFLGAYPEYCSGAFLEDGSPVEPPDVYAMTYRTSWQTTEEPDHEIRLYRYRCFSGAYNVGHVLFSASDDGILPLQLAQPTFRVIYEGGGTGVEGGDEKVEDIILTGMTTYATVTNSEVDAESRTIRSNSYWRGIGDASSIAEWRLTEGNFALVAYDIDASYDGAINPTRVWDTTEALAGNRN